MLPLLFPSANSRRDPAHSDGRLCLFSLDDPDDFRCDIDAIALLTCRLAKYASVNQLPDIQLSRTRSNLHSPGQGGVGDCREVEEIVDELEKKCGCTSLLQTRAVLLPQGEQIVDPPDRISRLNRHCFEEVSDPFLQSPLLAYGKKMAIVIVPVPLEIRAQIQQGLREELLRAEKKSDQEPPDASVPIKKWMNNLELVVDQGEAHDRGQLRRLAQPRCFEKKQVKERSLCALDSTGKHRLSAKEGSYKKMRTCSPTCLRSPWLNTGR